MVFLDGEPLGTPGVASCALLVKQKNVIQAARGGLNLPIAAEPTASMGPRKGKASLCQNCVTSPLKARLAGAVARRDTLQSERVVQHACDSLDLLAGRQHEMESANRRVELWVSDMGVDSMNATAGLVGWYG